jgi:flagellar assembly factor FliW
MGDIRKGSGGDIAVVSIVTLEPRAGDATVNLTAPIFINMRTHICKQVICEEPVCMKQKLSIRCGIMKRTDEGDKGKMFGALMKLKGV